MHKSIATILILASFMIGTKKHASVYQAASVRESNDTDFISREVRPGYYHAVYIERNRRSDPYNWVLDFKMDSNDNANYQQNYQALKEHIKSPLKTYHLGGLPKDWLPLYRYKGKYYIYSACEPGLMGKTVVTDSTIIGWGFDVIPEALSKVEKIDGHTWHLETDPHGLQYPRIRVTIHIIDPKKYDRCLGVSVRASCRPL